jgi:cytochrome c553
MKFRPTLLALGLGILATAASMTAGAEGNAEQGKTLAYTCLGCHGVPNYKNAYPNYSVPRLGGQHAKYLAAALNEYSAGERSHPTMHAQATTLNDQDRADIGAYLHGAPLPPSQEVVGTPPPATQTCVACHGTDGAKTLTEDYPVLAGQYADYIVQALKEYKSGKRKNPVMAGIVTGVDEKDFPAIAQFFSQQRGLCGSDVITKQGKCR